MNAENQLRHVWKLAAGIGIIVISIILTMFIAEGLQLRHKCYNPFNLGLLIGTIIFLKSIYQVSFSELGLTFNKQQLIYACYGIIILFGVGFLSFAIDNFTFRYVFPAIDSALIFLLVRYIIVGAGEELLFRVFLIGYFKKKINVFILILVSSMLFAAFHLLGQKNINLGYLFNVYIIGLFLSLLYLISNSFYLVLVYHVLHNTFHFHTENILPFRICICIAILFLIIILIFKYRNQKQGLLANDDLYINIIKPSA